MPEVTLSSKNQITLPVEMVRALGLKGGDKLIVFQVSDHLALFPKPANFADYIVGSMKGFWGSKEEIDRYIDGLRASPERDEWREGVEDILATDELARRVAEELSALPDHVAFRNELRRRIGPLAGEAAVDSAGKHSSKLDVALERLIEVGAVRRIQGPSDSAAEREHRYRLVREFVRPSQGAPKQ